MPPKIVINQPPPSIELTTKQEDGFIERPSAEMVTGDLPHELGELVVDDTDGSDYDPSPKKPVRALGAVRNKLGRKFSLEADLKRQSLASIGQSEPEIARRVELKKIMHKRIQDELKSESEQSESSDTSTRSHRYLTPLIDFRLPGSGPRDTVEFTVTGGATGTGSDQGQLAPEGARETAVRTAEETTGAAEEARRCSCPETAKGSPPARLDVKKLFLADRGSLPEFTPPSPEILPVKLPSDVQEVDSLKSQKLSHSPAPANFVLGPKTGLVERDSSNSQESLSALNTWLIAQGYESPEQSPIRTASNRHDTADKVTSPTSNGFNTADGIVNPPSSESNTASNGPNAGPHELPATEADQLGVSRPEIELSPTVHLWDMDISVQLACSRRESMAVSQNATQPSPRHRSSTDRQSVIDAQETPRLSDLEENKHSLGRNGLVVKKEESAESSLIISLADTSVKKSPIDAEPPFLLDQKSLDALNLSPIQCKDLFMSLFPLSL